jgi:hypothetical protein
MNIARFNFSHGSHEYHQGTLDNLRQAMRETRIMCAVMLDTKVGGWVADAKRMGCSGGCRAVGEKSQYFRSALAVRRSRRQAAAVCVRGQVVHLDVAGQLGWWQSCLHTLALLVPYLGSPCLASPPISPLHTFPHLHPRRAQRSAPGSWRTSSRWCCRQVLS